MSLQRTDTFMLWVEFDMRLLRSEGCDGKLRSLLLSTGPLSFPQLSSHHFAPQSGAAQLPKIYGFNSALVDEDCLFLNIYAPPGGRDLPVLVWIRKLMFVFKCLWSANAGHLN